MPGMFGILEIAKKGLNSQQSAISVASHNIANVNTPGYSVQSAVLQESTPIVLGGVAFGQGSDVTNISRSYDQFLQQQLFSQNSQLSNYQSLSDSLSQLQTSLNDQLGTGMATQLNNFWNAWQNLTTTPDGVSQRQTVVQQGVSLAQNANQIYNQFTDSQKEADSSIIAQVGTINSVSQSIAALNGKIQSMEAMGNNANDYRDQRDQLIQQLGGIVGNSMVTDTSNGDPEILVCGYAVVSGQHAYQLSTDASMPNGYSDVYWTGDGSSKVDITAELSQGSSGSVAGLLQFRDVKSTQYINQLNTMVQSVVTAVNNIHASGSGLAIGTGGGNARPGFTSLTSVNAVTDSTKPLDSVGLAFPPSMIGKSFQMATYDKAGNITDIGAFKITQGMTLQNLVDQINNTGVQNWTQDNAGVATLLPAGSSPVSASIDSTNHLVLQYNDSATNPNGAFTFANDQAGILSALGLNTFFTGSDASNIGVNDVLTNDVNQLAAGNTNVGDSTTQYVIDTNLTGNNGLAVGAVPAGSLRFTWTGNGTTPNMPRLNSLVDIEFDPTAAPAVAAADNGKFIITDTGTDANGHAYFEVANAAGVASGNLTTAPNGYILDGTLSASDNRVASSIASVQNQKILDSNTHTVSDYYSSMISNIGTDTQTATNAVTLAKASMDQLTNLRNSTSGVSIDEEMTNLIKFQQGYVASTRVVTTFNTMMDNLLAMIA